MRTTLLALISLVGIAFLYAELMANVTPALTTAAKVLGQ